MLNWFCVADRMLFFGVTLAVASLVYLILLIAEYRKEMRKRKNKNKRR